MNGYLFITEGIDVYYLFWTQGIYDNLFVFS